MLIGAYGNQSEMKNGLVKSVPAGPVLPLMNTVLYSITLVTIYSIGLEKGTVI